MNFQHMSAKEINSHIEKFGTDEQRLLAEKLYIDPEFLDWEYCPNCQITSDELDDLVISSRNKEEKIDELKTDINELEDKLHRIFVITDE